MLKMVVTRQFHVRGIRRRKGREKLKLLKMDSIDPTAVQQESTGHVARGHRRTDPRHERLFPELGMCRVLNHHMATIRHY